MNIKTKIVSGFLSAALAFGTFSAPLFEINAAAYSSSASASSSTAVPKLDITDSSFIKYTYGSNNFKSKYIWLYDFCDDMHTGVGNRMVNNAYTEMYMGIHAYIKKDSLYFKFYNNCKQEWTVKNVKLVSDKNENKLKIKDTAKYTWLDTSKYANGLYKIEMGIVPDGGKDTKTAVMYFYVNSGKTYLCSYVIMNDRRMNNAIERRKTIEKLIKDSGITPDNSRSTESLCFPWHPSVGCNDVPKWSELAHKITKDEWSDSLKAFAIHEWMTANLAYDRYKSDVIKQRRGSYYKDYSGKQDTYQTKVGVCFDFANIYAIMCRSVGVPAVTVDTMDHTWNMIYINGKWFEADLTTDVNRVVYGEDVTDIRNKNSIYSYDGYATLNVNTDTPEMINRWLWNYDNSKAYK